MPLHQTSPLHLECGQASLPDGQHAAQTAATTRPQSVDTRDRAPSHALSTLLLSLLETGTCFLKIKRNNPEVCTKHLLPTFFFSLMPPITVVSLGGCVGWGRRCPTLEPQRVPQHRQPSTEGSPRPSLICSGFQVAGSYREGHGGTTAPRQSPSVSTKRQTPPDHQTQPERQRAAGPPAQAPRAQQRPWTGSPALKPRP